MALPVLSRRRKLDKDALVKRAIAVACDPKILKAEERREVEPVVKALQYGAGQGQRSGKPVSAAVLAQRAHQALGPSSGLTPPDIAAALVEQGLDWVQPFPPGQPLVPYYGYGRRPRQLPYPVGYNITTETRPSRIPFTTLYELWKSYDVAQACTRYSIQDLRSMRIRFEAMDGYKENPVKEITEAKRFLRHPDGFNTTRNFIAANQRNLWIFDSAPIFRLKNKGGRLTQLKNVTPRTIAPVLDYYGDVPDGDAPAYQQFITGVPWDWLKRENIIYQPFWPQTDSPYGTPPLETVLVNANCYSADTEVLTRGGWKNFADVDIDTDEFATRNPVTGELEWQWASKHHRAPGDGVMFHAKSKNVDLLVTGGHRLLVDRVPKGCPGVKHGDMWLVHAEDLYRYQQALPSGGRAVFAPATSAWNAPDLLWFPLPYADCETVRFEPSVLRGARAGRSFNSLGQLGAVSRATLAAAERGSVVRRSSATAICRLYGLAASAVIEAPRFFSGGMPGDDFAAFMGMWLSEGSVRSTSSNIYIAQCEKSKGFGEYGAALQRLLGRPARHDGRGFTFGHTALADYLRQFGHADEKFIPQAILDMSRRQLEIFWHFYVLGDGHYHPAGHVSVTTVSRRMADGLQEVVQKLGMSAAVHRAGSPKSARHHQRWVLNTRAKERYSIRLEKVPYSGEVFCVSVPNKTLYVRRNGVPAWCANTDIRLQMFFLQFFTAGAVPEMFAIAPEDMTSPDDLADLQEQWTSEFTGTQARLHGLKFLPHGTELQPYKPQQFDPDLAEYVMRRTIAAFGLVPQNLGLLDDVNRSSATTQMDQQFRISTLPIVGYYEDLFDSILQETLTLPVQIRFDTGREKEDRLMEARAHLIYWQMGAESSTEVREKILGYPINPEEKIPRTVMDQRLGIIPMAHILAVSGDVDPLTGAPVPGSVAPVPYELPGGGTPVPAAGPTGGSQTAADAGPKGTPTKVYPKPLLAASKEATDGPDEDSEYVGYGLWDIPHGSSGQGTGATHPPVALEEYAELRKWRAQSRRRVAGGKPPRRFDTSLIQADRYERVWKCLQGATTRKAVDAAFAKGTSPKAAGVVVQAHDTGRVLMVQRKPDKHDPGEAFSRWEFPGGKLTGDDPWTGGVREWSEETGATLPEGFGHLGNWTSPDGVYVGYVVEVPSERSLALAPQREEVSDARWWGPDELDDPEVRDKVTESLTRVLPLLKAWTTQPRGRRGRWRTPHQVRLEQFHRHTDRLVAHYAPEIQREMARLTMVAVLSVMHRAMRVQKATTKRPTQAAIVAGASAGIGVAVAGGGAVAVGGAGVGAAAILAQLESVALTASSAGLVAVLSALYADAYMQAVKEATQATGGAPPPWTTGVAAPDDGTWEAQGAVASAVQSLAGTGLSKLLAEAGVVVKGVDHTQLERIASAIATGIEDGFPVAQVEQEIREIIDTPTRAHLIAETEYARAMAAGQMDVYRRNGVPELQWLIEPGACPKCVANHEASPQPTMSPRWPSGPIPVHPHTRCVVAPYYGSLGG